MLKFLLKVFVYILLGEVIFWTIIAISMVSIAGG